MAIFLGIDPGSRITGYGVITSNGRRHQYLASGCIITKKNDDQAKKLRQIHEGINLLLNQFTPQEVAIEQVFVNRNVLSALKLGQVRGVVMAAVALQNLTIAEYAPRKIKQTVTGYGAADKEQMIYMVKRHLNVTGQLAADAADALAIAICHAQHHLLKNKILEEAGVNE